MAAILARTGRLARPSEQMFASSASIPPGLGQMFVSGRRVRARGLRDRPGKRGRCTHEERAASTHVEPVDGQAR